MERLTRLVLRHRFPVLAAWATLLAVSLLAWSSLSDLLTNRFSLPGTDTAAAERILEEEFGQKTTGTFTIVVRGERGSAARLVPAAQEAAERAAAELPTSTLVDARPVSASVVSAQIASTLEPAEAKRYTADMRAAAGEIAGAELFVSGQPAIEYDLDPVLARDLRVGELYIAIPIAALILVFVFGTLAVFVPLMFAAATIPTTLGIVWIFANFMELTTYLQNLVMLIGLGIAIDYSLLVVHRYREELRAGRSREAAIVRTMETAGRAVVFSGTAVAIGLALMLFMPLPFIRGFGIGGLAIPLVSVAAALTLLPVLLHYLAARLDAIRLLPRAVTDRRERERNAWSRLAHAIMRRPVVFAVGTAALLLALAAPVLDIELGPGSNSGIPQDLEGVRGLNIVGEAVGEGALAPTVVIVDTGRPGGASDPAVTSALARLTSGLEADPEVAAVDFAPDPRHIDPSGRYVRLDVVGESEYGAPAALEFVDRLRGDIVPRARFPSDATVVAGGGPPSGADFLDLIYGAFPWLVVGVLALTYVLLLRAFRSLVLPLKAIVLNLLSIGAAYGLLIAFFKWGGADRVGLIGFEQIEGWIPVFIFAMVFGLSMDYEVFLVSRMREEWDAGKRNEQAVATGLAKTGRIVTAAGMIMVAAFFGFLAGSVVGLQQFGFGLAVAIALDVTIVRALLVPSAMKLFGRWNWWLPPRVARAFRVQPSPLEPRHSAAAARGR